jgi:hypothetical protein
MRTKTLLIAAAALAATVITSQAQVYSANIVGYTTQVLGNQYSAQANPLDISGGNTLTNLFPNPGSGGGNNPLDFDYVYVWNGNGYSQYTLDSDYPSGVANQTDTAGVTAPIITPGQLVYFQNNEVNSGVVTNVLAGTVHVDAAATGSESVGQTTNVISLGYNFFASKISVAGGLESVLQLPNSVVGGNGGINGGSGPMDFSYVYVPNINANGQFLGYTQYTIDSDYSTGFANQTDTAQVAEPQIPLGAGFIVQYLNINGAGSTVNWVQTF